MIKEIDKKQVINLIKKYYERNYLGQAIKIKIETKKIELSNQSNQANKNCEQNDLFFNYNLSVENSFTVMGYLEEGGYLHKFSKKLDSDEVKTIIAESIDENIEKMEMNNKLKYSISEKDKIGIYFSGIKLHIEDKKKIFKKEIN